ncbi:MAG: hypothetical protein K0S86_4263, partial [Geminicoccaceae bacterium]|nr:hypothetical protein [Geminicoccaceae bacterium]
MHPERGGTDEGDAGDRGSESGVGSRESESGFGKGNESRERRSGRGVPGGRSPLRFRLSAHRGVNAEPSPAVSGSSAPSPFRPARPRRTLHAGAIHPAAQFDAVDARSAQRPRLPAPAQLTTTSAGWRSRFPSVTRRREQPSLAGQGVAHPLIPLIRSPFRCGCCRPRRCPRVLCVDVGLAAWPESVNAYAFTCTGPSSSIHGYQTHMRAFSTRAGRWSLALTLAAVATLAARADEPPAPLPITAPAVPILTIG